MLIQSEKHYMKSLLALFLLSAIVVGTAHGATYDICTGASTLTMPDGAVIDVWGFGIDTTGTPGDPCNVTVPGPTIRLNAGDSSLRVNLRNELNVYVGLHILGQQLVTNNGPMWGGASGDRPDLTARVHSFTHHARPNGGKAAFKWGTDQNPFRPGTYMLQSSTNPAIQVNMGLSAPVIKDAAAGVAYADNPSIPGDQSVPYTRDIVLVFQEIDVGLHSDPAGFPVINREPEYFLINGRAYPDPDLDPVNPGMGLNPGDRLLVRFINAGAMTHLPELIGGDMILVAEDGYLRNYPQRTCGIDLYSAKTADVIYEVPGTPVTLPVIDGRLRLSNAGGENGGMLVYFNLGGDDVEIFRTGYVVSAGELRVFATSSAQPSAQLVVAGYGPMVFAPNETPPQYKGVFPGVARPDAVRVISDQGGTDTALVP